MTRERPRPPDPETLLRESRWLRRLACGLVGPDAADDVVQSTWLAALEHPPREPGRLRSWLKSVTTNLALRSLWRENRRPRVERASARPESLPSTAELVGQMALQRRIVDEVLALEEPIRSTVILVFFHDLGAAEAARRLQVPASTVRSRVARGLVRLRERLDAGGGHGGDWKPMLAGFAGVGPLVSGAAAGSAAAASGATLGALIMTAKAKVFVVALCAVIGGVFLWRALGVASGGPAVPATQPADAPPDAGAPALPHRVRDAATEAKPIVPRPFVEAERAPASAADAPGGVLVKLVWASDGADAANVPFSVIIWGEQDCYLNQIRSRSDETGTGRVAGLRAGKVTVVSIWGGRADGTVEAGKDLAVKVAIPAGPAVEGVVVDWAGHPVPGAAILAADMGSTSEAQQVGAAGADGAFRLASTKAETWLLVGARADGYVGSPFTILTGKAGATLRARLVLGQGAVEVAGVVMDEGGTPVRGAIVQIGDGQDSQSVQPDGSHVAEAATFRAITDREGAFRLAGLLPRKTIVFARAAGFAPTKEEIEVPAGGLRAVRLVLRRGATIVGKVLDAAGAPVARADVTIGSHWTLEGARTLSANDGSFTLDGVAVGEVSVAAEADDKGKANATLRTTAGQKTEWTARLSNGEEIKGRIVDERGAPLPGCFVDLRSVGSTPIDAKWETSDQEGRFVARNCAQQQYLIEVHDPKGGSSTIAQVRGVKPGGPDVLIQIADDARATAWLTGAVLGPDGKPVPAQVSLWRVLDGGSPIISPDPQTGAFKGGPLAPGDYRLTVRADGFPSRRLESIRLERGQTLDVGTIKLAPGGFLVVALASEPGADADVSLTTSCKADHVTTHLTVAGTEARSPPLSEGAHVLRVSGKDLATQEIPFDIRPGEATSLSVTLVPGVQIGIRLDDPAGASESPGASVTIRDAAGAIVFETETLRYPHYPRLEAVVGLRNGVYRLEAVAQGTGRKCVAEITIPPTTPDRNLTFVLE